MAAQAILERESAQPLSLSIGSTHFQILFLQEELFHRAMERYRGFEGAGNAPFSIRLLESSEGADPIEFEFEWQGAALRYGNGEAVFSGVRHEYALDSLLRVLLSWTLLPKKGFLLHAATILRGGRTFVFAGRSGAGKSTIASLAPAGTVLTDEISMLSGEGAEWRAFGTPFWGEFRAEGKQAHAPVAGIFQLVQAPHNRIEQMRPADAVRMLLPNVLFFSKDAGANRRLLELVTEAVCRVPCFRFEFRRDASLWEALPS